MGGPFCHPGAAGDHTAVIIRDLPIVDAKQIGFDANVDERGHFGRLFCEREVAAAAFPFHIHQINVSRNTRAGTLRGLHYQAAPRPDPKIVRCIRGAVWDVTVDLRPDSASYLAWHGCELAAESGDAVLVPPGCAHGFVTLTDDSELLYLMGETYVPELARGVRWDDPAFGIK